MASLDQNGIPFKMPITALALADGGANTLTITLVQGTMTYTVPGRAWVEAMEKGRHQGTPVSIETTDGNVTGSITALVDSWLGDTAVTPMEFMTFTGGASGFATVGAGAKKQFRLTVTTDSTVDGGASQTIVFGNCICEPYDVDLGGTEEMATISFTFTDLENYPTYA
mgnify:FL=1